MAKRKTLKIRRSPQIDDYLDQLVACGLFGLTKEEVVERFIGTELQRLLRDGWIKIRRRRKK